MFSLEYPLVLLLIIPIFLCIFFCRTKGLAIYFPQSQIINNLTKNKTIFIGLLKFLILTSLIVALSSPVKTQDVIIDTTKGYEISLILDVSGSMERFNKFEIVKEIVLDFIDKRKTDKLALSIFADFAYVAVPLTYDKKSIKNLLKNINIGIAGTQKTALYEALFLSANLYKNSKSKEKIAILLTDGMDNANTVPLDIAISIAKKYKIKVYTIGIGTKNNINPSVLRKIAKETGGKFFISSTKKGIEEIYKTIDLLEKSEIKINKYIKKTYYFQYLLFLILFLILIYFWQKNK